MKKLIAKRPVLYGARMYEPGDTLPAGDAKMVAAWLDAKSAEWSGAPAEAPENGQKPPREPQDGADAPEETPEVQGTESGEEAPENGQDGVTVLHTVKLVDGHLDPEQLATMKKADLEDLADKLGVDISKAKNNGERAALIAAVTVQAPVDENGGAQ